jgi:hypothetical protein
VEFSRDHLDVDEGMLGDEIDRAILDLDAQIVLIELLDPPFQHRAVEQVELQQALIPPQVSEKVGLFGFGGLGCSIFTTTLLGEIKDTGWERGRPNGGLMIGPGGQS